MSVPSGVKPVPNGYVTPNSSLPIYSMAMIKFVALHRFADKELWVVYQHPDGHWVTLRKATAEDVSLFRNAGAMQEVTP